MNEMGTQGVSEKLGTLIEGESLFNDGSAIVVFEVFLGELCRLALLRQRLPLVLPSLALPTESGLSYYGVPNINQTPRYFKCVLWSGVFSPACFPSACSSVVPPPPVVESCTPVVC